MSRFASIRSARDTRVTAATEPSTDDNLTSRRAFARTGKKAVSGYFSPEASRQLHLLALENGVSLQALMGEAFDDLMRKYGKHPFGER